MNIVGSCLEPKVGRSLEMKAVKSEGIDRENLVLPRGLVSLKLTS